MFTTLKLYLLGGGCFVTGVTVAGIIADSKQKGFRDEYFSSPAFFWVSVVLNLLVIFLLARRARQIVQGRKVALLGQTRANVTFSPIGWRVQTTPFVRWGVYAGMYIFGLCMVFIFK